MKLRLSGVQAKVVEATEQELSALNAALTFQVNVMRMPYIPSEGRKITWEATPKCYLFDKYFASPFCRYINFPYVSEVVEREVVPSEISFPELLKDFQAKALPKVLEFQSALVVGPTSSGKTYLIGALVSAFRKFKVVVLVHNKGLAAQNFEKLSTWFPDLRVGRIFGGVKEFDSPISVATFQSLRGLPFKADVALIDECTHTLAPTFLKVLIHTEAQRWYGFTATPKGRADRLDSKLAALFQNRVDIATIKEGMEEKLICPVEFYCIKYYNPQYKIPKWRERDVNYVYQKFIALDESRNELIHSLAEFELSRMDKVVLILVHRMSHLSALKKLLPNAVTVSYKSGLKEREAVRKLKRGVIIATRVIEEGVDNHEIYTIINAACVRSRIAIIQRIGRGLRFEEGKKLSYYDIIDQSPETVNSQGNERITMYHKLGKVYVLDPSRDS